MLNFLRHWTPLQWILAFLYACFLTLYAAVGQWGAVVEGAAVFVVFAWIGHQASA